MGGAAVGIAAAAGGGRASGSNASVGGEERREGWSSTNVVGTRPVPKADRVRHAINKLAHSRKPEQVNSVRRRERGSTLRSCRSASVASSWRHRAMPNGRTLCRRIPNI